MAIQSEKKPRKKQVVINELATAYAEAYAAKSLARQYENQVCELQYELDRIIQQEVNN